MKPATSTFGTNIETGMLALAVAPGAVVHADVAAAAAAATTPATVAPVETRFGTIEQVATFRAAMPTGVTAAADGRIFVNFPR
jgi:hypothetical protein